jgi:N-acylneuraminate cytidylyltransferase/CMP-N,N'-diacetyllegionaminic acid synthase
LIAYTLETAIKWGQGEAIVVSSDSQAILDVAATYGINTPFVRPAELAQDATPKLPVIRHALMQAEEVYGKKFDLILDLDPTAPLRTVQDIQRAVALMQDPTIETVFSVVSAHKNPYFNMVEVSDGRVTLSKQLPAKITRRQDAPRVYDMNASIYVYRRAYLLNPAVISPIAPSSQILEMDPISGFDVDREVDLKFLEFVLREGLFTWQ